MRHHRQRLRRYRLFALPAWGAFALACLTLIGYVTGQENLISLHARWQGMSPVTALCLAGLSIPLNRLFRKNRVAVLTPFLVIVTFGAYVLISHALFRKDVVSAGFLASTGIVTSAAGSMSVATSLCILLLAVAGIARQLFSVGWTETLNNAVLLVSGSALLGYAYGIQDLYSFYIFNTMAINTALALFLLATANLLAEPRSRLGMAARAMHPAERRALYLVALSLLPAVLGWLVLRLDYFAGAGDSFIVALVAMAVSVAVFYATLAHSRRAVLSGRGTNQREDAPHRLWRFRGER